MKRMNLRDMYPFLKTDVWVDLDEEVAQEIRRFEMIYYGQIRNRYCLL